MQLSFRSRLALLFAIIIVAIFVFTHSFNDQKKFAVSVLFAKSTALGSAYFPIALLLLVLVCALFVFFIFKFLKIPDLAITSTKKGGDENIGSEGSQNAIFGPDDKERELPNLTKPMRRFLVEAMVSAGPRKSKKDYENDAKTKPELCEDAAGVLSLEDATFLWWISDGTSEKIFLPPMGEHPGLSTRMLARDLGECFVHAHLGHGNIKGAPPAKLHESMLSRLEEIWNGRMRRYIDALKSLNRYDAFWTWAPKNASNNPVLDWSSKFLGGHFSAKSGILDVHQAGDSGALIFHSDRARIVSPDKAQVTVRLTLDADDIVCQIFVGTDQTISYSQFEQVTGFIAMSDGIAVSGDSENHLLTFMQNLQTLTESENLQESIRNHLVQRSDKSYDDKSLVIGRYV